MLHENVLPLAMVDELQAEPCEPQFEVLWASQVLLYTWYPLLHVSTVHVPNGHENVLPFEMTDELQALPCVPQLVVLCASHVLLYT